MTRIACSQANRGRILEDLLKWTNERYRVRGLAVVHKVPTAFIPIRSSQTDEHGRRPIVTAKVEERAAVDFIGVAGRYALAFDAKETHEPRWSLARLEEHQAAFLADWDAQGGLAFVLVAFVPQSSTYLVPWQELAAKRAAWKERRGPASITEGELRQSRRAIPSARGVPLDYLAEVEWVWPVPPRQTAERGGERLC